MYIKLESELPWIKSKKEIPIRYGSHYVIKGSMPVSGKLWLITLQEVIMKIINHNTFLRASGQCIGWCLQ